MHTRRGIGPQPLLEPERVNPVHATHHCCLPPYLVTMAPSLALPDTMLIAQDGAIDTPIYRASITHARALQRIDLGPCPLTICAILGIAWLPDGSGFLLSRQETGFSFGSAPPEGGVIYGYDFVSGQLTEYLRLPGEAIGRIALSPNGQTVVFERSHTLDETVKRVETGPRLLCPCELWLVERDGSNTRLLVSDGRAPVWSPLALSTLSLPRPQ